MNLVLDLGVRHIRTSGKGSGSIELTLPAGLRDLVGVPCRVLLQDGGQPRIVLQPDMQVAEQAFAAFWHAMVQQVLPPGTLPPPFQLTAYQLTLHPEEGMGAPPRLAWRDGMQLSGIAPTELDGAAIARCLASFGQILAPLVGIAPAHAADFGQLCAYTATAQFACADAEPIWHKSKAALPDLAPGGALAAALAAHETPPGPHFWQVASAALRSLIRYFKGMSG